jgi:hypothetical protein
MKQHRYEIQMEWTGNDGHGTRMYRSYRRDHSIWVGEKPLGSGRNHRYRDRAIWRSLATPGGITRRNYW